MSTVIGRSEAKVHVVWQLEGQVEEVDVFSLAPALLSFGTMVREAHQALNPEQDPVSVKIRPFREGSFHVDVVLLAHVALGVFPFITADRVRAVKDTLEFLGVIKSSAATVLDFVKLFKGEDPKREERPGGEVVWEAPGKSLVVNAPVDKLVQNNTVVHNHWYSMVQPALGKNVERVRSYLDQDEEATACQVSRADAEELQRAAERPLFAASPVVRNTVETVFLNPKSGPYGGRGTFRFVRGDESFPAAVDDESFLTRIETGAVKLHHSDLLYVELAVTETVVGTKVNVSRRVVRVLDYREGCRDARDTDAAG